MNLPTGFDQRFDSLRLVRELGSYSAAAQELNLSPSAIAQQIHALERELDALLFIRDGNRLLPTEVCEKPLITRRRQRHCGGAWSLR